MTQKLYRSFIVILLVSVNLLFFQNCAPKKLDAANPSSSLTSSSTIVTAAVKDNGGVCPISDPPLCLNGIKLSITDSTGCEKWTCSESTTQPSCPQYNIPRCQQGEHLVARIDQKKCMYPICEANFQCPADLPAECPNGQLQTQTDAAGCSHTVCVKSRDLRCPLYMIPICESGSSVVLHADQNQCPVPSCEKVIPFGARASL